MSEGRIEASIPLERETLVGDLRDAALDWIRLLEKPWPKLSEERQRDIIDSITSQARVLVLRAIEIVATDGFQLIEAQVDLVQVKGALKVVLAMPKTESTLMQLGMRQGGKVFVIPTGAEPYAGERKPAKPDPDQRKLLKD